MKIFLTVFAFFTVILLVCCNGIDNRHGITAAATFRVIDLMEGNWQLSGPNDTSFICMGKGTGDTLLTTFHYRFQEGDTLLLHRGYVLHTQAGISWSLFNKSYLLNLVDSTMLHWSEEGNQTKDDCTWQKLDSANGLLQMPGRTIRVRKSLPFSVLLVRKRYDFEHHTTFADSAEVKRRAEK